VFFGDILFKGKLFDEGSISELSDAFSKVYPNLNNELEKTRLNLPTLIKHELDREKHLSEVIRNQENCKPHDYMPVPEDRGKNKITFRCRKCGKLRKKKII
jgi:rubrerythrin